MLDVLPARLRIACDAAHPRSDHLYRHLLSREPLARRGSICEQATLVGVGRVALLDLNARQ